VLSKVVGWILHREVGKELEVHEFEQSTVEFKEGAHDLVIYVEGQFLIKLIWSYPCDRLPHYFYLVIDSLDRKESFLETLSDG
jgi:hypothetical protein